MSEEVQETEATTELPPQEERDFVVAEDLETKTEERPEWLPEKYKTGEDLAKAYKELESKLGTKDEDIRAELLKEIMILLSKLMRVFRNFITNKFNLCVAF